jgi:cytochrome c peroxidase
VNGRLASCTGALALCALAFAADPLPELDAVLRARVARHAPLPPPPPDPTNRFADDPRAAALGQALFFDARLSSNGAVRCATCHDPALGFADGKPVAEGLATGTRNTPGLWNVAQQRWFVWDGRSDTLWGQALHPLESPLEMGGNRVAVARTIAADGALRTAFEELFGPLPDLDDRARFPDARPAPDGAVEDALGAAWDAMDDADRAAVTAVFVGVGKALAAYQRLLVSAGSPFDRFAAALARGDESAARAELSPAAQRGLVLFMGRGDCRACHSGPGFSDGEFHALGLAPRDGGPPRDPGRHAALEQLARDPFSAAGAHSDAPDGEAAAELARLVGGPEAWGQFKTPSLRNVALTAPYAHDGKFATLADVVRFYSTLDGMWPQGHHGERLLVPLDLDEREVGDLVAFLESLTDASIDPALLAAPRDAER